MVGWVVKERRMLDGILFVFVDVGVERRKVIITQLFVVTWVQI